MSEGSKVWNMSIRVQSEQCYSHVEGVESVKFLNKRLKLSFLFDFEGVEGVKYLNKHLKWAMSKGSKVVFAAFTQMHTDMVYCIHAPRPSKREGS